MPEACENWDVFISYASEQRQSVAEPLARILESGGLRVWIDQTALKVGDSLHRSIDDGLARSRFGIVILSKDFFRKHWTQRELDGLGQRETSGARIILPVWYDVSESEVAEYSLPLAGRFAAQWTDGLDRVVTALLKVVDPAALERIHAARRRVNRKELHTIDEGKSLAMLVAGAHMFQSFYDSIESSEESDEVAAFLQDIQDWGDIWSDIDIGQRVRAEFEMHTRLVSLKANGWSVYGRRVQRMCKTPTGPLKMDVAAVAVIRGKPRLVVLDGKSIFVMRQTEPEPVGSA